MVTVKNGIINQIYRKYHYMNIAFTIYFSAPKTKVGYISLGNDDLHIIVKSGHQTTI